MNISCIYNIEKNYAKTWIIFSPFCRRKSLEYNQKFRHIKDNIKYKFVVIHKKSIIHEFERLHFK